MTNQEQNIAVAKALGHKVFRANGQEGSAWYGGSRVTSAGGAYIISPDEVLPGQPRVFDIPRYGIDLNACNTLVDHLQAQGWDCVLVAQNGKRLCTCLRLGVEHRAISEYFATSIREVFLRVHNLHTD